MVDIVQSDFAPNIHHADRRVRSRCRRAVLAAELGGFCKCCMLPVDDYGDLSQFEFDHIYDVYDYDVSPDTNIRQFRISGNDCARRKWETVRQHALTDCQLLCKGCHIYLTQERIATRMARSLMTGLQAVNDDMQKWSKAQREGRSPREAMLAKVLERRRNLLSKMA